MTTIKGEVFSLFLSPQRINLQTIKAEIFPPLLASRLSLETEASFNTPDEFSYISNKQIIYPCFLFTFTIKTLCFDVSRAKVKSFTSLDSTRLF